MMLDVFRTVSLACVMIAVIDGGSAHADQWCFAAGSIPDAVQSTRTLVVPPTQEARTITGVRVRIVATHPWVGDLSFTLRHPSGASVILVDRAGTPSTGYPGPWGCGGDNIDAWFDDGAAQPAESACPYGLTPVLSGTLRPTESLASLVGRAPQGTWTLVVGDAVTGDTGSLSLACIDVSSAPDCNANGIPDATDIASGASADLNLDGIPDECACVADLDGNGQVDGADLAGLLAAWGACTGCSADITADGQVQADDLAILLSSWGACGPA